MPTFAELLRRLIDDRGWSTKTLADRTGIPAKTLYSYFLHGDSGRLPSVRQLVRLAAVLEVPLTTLLACQEFSDE